MNPLIDRIGLAPKMVYKIRMIKRLSGIPPNIIHQNSVLRNLKKRFVEYNLEKNILPIS